MDLSNINVSLYYSLLLALLSSFILLEIESQIRINHDLFIWNRHTHTSTCSIRLCVSWMWHLLRALICHYQNRMSIDNFSLSVVLTVRLKQKYTVLNVNCVKQDVIFNNLTFLWFTQGRINYAHKFWNLILLTTTNLLIIQCHRSFQSHL